MNFYPHLSEEALLRDLRDLRVLYTSGSGSWPIWMQDSPNELLRKKKFIVCGSMCRPEIRVLAKHANVIAVVDDVIMKRGGGKVFGIDVIGSDAWVDIARNDDSIVSLMLLQLQPGYQHFTKLQMQWGLQALSPLQFLQMLTAAGVDKSGEPGRFFWYGEEFFHRTLNNLDKLIESRKRFGDSWSCISWLCVLLYRMTLNPFYLSACAVGHNTDQFNLNSYSMNRQFLRFSDDEVYVDGGAFTGDTIGQFIRAVGGKFRRIHSFEPSSDNNRAIAKMLSRLQDEYLWPLRPKVTLHEKGLWGSETTLLFNPSQLLELDGTGASVNPASAHMVDAGMTAHLYGKEQEFAISTQVHVTTIDAATNREATFVKLEIEGSELQALHGARETIARNRPKMAISIYHKPEDLETLLDFVLETGQDYNLGFRQHNPWAPDAMVLYCW